MPLLMVLVLWVLLVLLVLLTAMLVLPCCCWYTDKAWLGGNGKHDHGGDARQRGAGHHCHLRCCHQGQNSAVWLFFFSFFCHVVVFLRLLLAPVLTLAVAASSFDIV